MISSPWNDITLAPAPEFPPPCFQCKSPSKRHITSPSNTNGNAYRPYYKCPNCPKFLCFADTRGNIPSNPPCQCGKSSKLQAAGWNSEIPGGLHFVCRLGTCGYYDLALDRNKEHIVLSWEEVNNWIGARLL
ncbi:hypothetical protein NXS19_013020 [Fusarium pseudograminearum]|nr:hypothetical protein NXS19_013020 [Fusarium pseudograminearum]